MLRLRVQVLGFGVQVLGFGVQVLGFRVVIGIPSSWEGLCGASPEDLMKYKESPMNRN